MKLAICMVASSTAFLILFSYVSLRAHRRHSEELIVGAADRITDVIRGSTRYQMLHNDREALYQMINFMGAEPGIRRIRIFNEEGRISFSTDQSEVNTVVDKRAEACYACHSQAAPLIALDRPDRARIFSVAGGERMLGLIRPIENQPACSNAACHAHPPERRILGVIDANLSLASVDAQIAEYRRQLAGLTGLSVVLASLASLVFILLVVHRPIRELIAGTHKVAGGELDYRLPVRSRDELGELAASFNKMTADLARARSEITAWARTLEERVEKKSEELQRAHASLLNSEKMASLGTLAATIAHEVNNPLFGILTYSRLVLKALEQSEPEPSARAEIIDQLRTIERESRRCGEIMKNLLTFARQAPPRRQPHDVDILVGRAITLIRHQLELQNIELESRLAGNLPPCSCDAQQVQQAVLALLVNAAEAMPQGGGLLVETGFDPGRASVRVRVRDTGPGIPEDVLPHIFEPFFTTKEDQHRTGLGLAVARAIVERHGGALEVATAPRSGTEFVITLPQQAPVAVDTGHNGDKT